MEAKTQHICLEMKPNFSSSNHKDLSTHSEEHTPWVFGERLEWIDAGLDLEMVTTSIKKVIKKVSYENTSKILLYTYEV